MSEYKRNHYVPKWYQERFLPDSLKEKKFYYLDLKPETVIKNNHRFTRNSLLRWGPPRCFYKDDLYTTKFGDYESTEIEQFFFGAVDSAAPDAIEYFANFTHPSVEPKLLHIMLPYMSIQKLRTPKGLDYFSALINSNDKNRVLHEMQRLRQIFCAIWTECIWSIADATESETKFIISDHPVTVYNPACFPGSKWCRGFNDPDIRLSGTHTLFPLNLNKILILTNLSWVRNPYGNPLKPRPNPDLFRTAMFNFTQIQTHRILSDLEVNEINYIIKSRAYRYIAATQKEWLYPENNIQTQYWNKLGLGYLLMPDPRSAGFSSEVIIGHNDGTADGFDAYGRRPWQPNYDEKTQSKKEWDTFHAFRGEYARVFGPKRRGLSYEFGSLSNSEDSPDYHSYHLSLERMKPKSAKKRKRGK